MGCDFCWADCLAGFGILGDFRDGRGDANRRVAGRVFDRCLNCDFWGGWAVICVGRIVWSRICRIWGDFQDGRGDANRCVFGRVFV